MTVKKLRSGKYQADWRDANGVRHRESFRTKKEAEDKLAAERLAPAPPTKKKVKEAAEEWLEAKKKSESKHGGPVKESSIQYWQNHIDHFIIPTLGSCRIDQVTTAYIEAQRSKWQEIGNLSGKSVNKILTTLTAIFSKQLRDRAISFNPAALADRMAQGSNEVGADGELDIDGLEVRPEEVCSPDQLLRFLNAAEPGFNRMILELFAFTGARHGEGLALAWSDIDFAHGEIMIRRNWSGTYRDGEPVFFTPKSKHSVRKIPIPDELALALKKWKLRCPASKYDLVFPKADGRPQDRKMAWRAIDAAIKKANETAGAEKLPRLTVHSLRHSFASIHLANGTPITEVSAMLGHSNVNITLSVYAHFIPKMRTDSATKFAASVFKAGEKAGQK